MNNTDKPMTNGPISVSQRKDSHWIGPEFSTTKLMSINIKLDFLIKHDQINKLKLITK